MKRIAGLFLLGTALFVICFKLTPPGILWFFISSLAGFAGMMFVRYILKVIDKKKKEGAAGFTPDQKTAEEVAKEGFEKLRQISNQTRMIANNDVAAKIKDICKVGIKIFDEIKKNPDNVKKARQFTIYYLDATKKIVDQYVDLSNKKELTDDIGPTLTKIEEMLDSIKATFEKQLAHLIEDDLLDLNAEITVLKNTMKLEG